MKKVFISDNLMEVHLVRIVLENEGIECQVENENLVLAYGEVPPTIDTLPAVVVKNDKDISSAEKIVEDFKKKRKPQEGEDAEVDEGSLFWPISALIFIAIIILAIILMLVRFFSKL